MTLKQESFRQYNLREDKQKIDTFTVRLNSQERAIINNCKKILEQKKDSTAIKQLAFIGAKVIHEEKTAFILGTLFKNKRNNARIGIVDFDQ